MKRIFWWTLFGISGAGLPLLWLGQSVFGQPELKETGPLTLTPIVLPKPMNPAPKSIGAKSSAGAPRMLEVTSGPFTDLQPVLTDPSSTPTPSAPVSPPPSTPLLPAVSPPLFLKTESTPLVLSPADAEKPAPAGVPLDVQPGRQQPALSIEWGAPATIRINQAMPCQILVRNMSNVAVHNVVVRHRLSPSVVCKASEPKVAHADGELVWNLGTLAPDQARRIELVLVSQTRGTLNCHASATFTAVAGHQVQVREPQLAIRMRAPETVIAGESVNLLLTISNPGDGVAESVKVKALLPEGLEHASGRKMIEMEVGNLAPKETKAMQLPCVAKGDGVQKCVIVAAGEGDLSSNDSAQIDILVPKLDVALSGPKIRYLDRRAIYVLKVANPGSAPATSVEVQGLIPAGFKFQQANHGGQFQEATRLVTWNIGDLQPGQSKDIAVDLIPIEVGEHRLIANVKTARGLRSDAETRTFVEGLPSLLIEVAHVDDPIEVGAETAYEIRVANTGTKTETNVEVVCTLPDELEFKGAKCTTTLRYRQEGRELIFEPLPRLAPKADVIYRIQVRGLAPGDIRFRTRIRADGLREPVMREESTRIYSDDVPLRSTPSVPPTPSNEAPLPIVPAPSSTLPVPRPTPMFPPATPMAPAPIEIPVPVPIPVPSNP